MLDTIREAPTPEGIELTLRVAGPVPRALAWTLDLLIRFAVLAIIQIPLAMLGRFGFGMALIVYFLMEWLYPTVFEALRGATPGKKAFGLRVLQDDGTPLTWGSALTRNLLRAVDFLPLMYGFGLVCMFVNRDFKRLGDLAAGTVVVYHKPALGYPAIPVVPAIAPASPLTLDERRTVLDYAARAPALTDERAAELASLVPHLTGGLSGAAAHQRLLALANHLMGRP
jgi:uncharacterized RDD family membrane protein YckC